MEYSSGYKPIKMIMTKKVLLLLTAALVFFNIAYAQNRQISGKVVDDTGEPLVGVGVSVKNSTLGTQTNADGGFTLSIPSANATLVFRYIGFKSKEVVVSNQSTLNVLLEQESTMLNEVVAIGYGTTTRETLTGSVSSVGEKQLRDIPVATAAEALAGRLAGVSVTTTEGAPGAEISIRVRGGASLTQDNSPLYIVDGIQVENALSIISPNEIQSIDVLKDVASTSIYGARGANGVVLITTKSGKEMRTTVSFDAYSGARQIVNSLEVMDPYEFVRYQYHRYNFGVSEGAAAEELKKFTDRYGAWDDLDIYKSMPFINWQDEVFGRSALSNTQVLNLSGGTKATTFNLTLNNVKEDGIMLESGFKRTFASFRFDTKVSEKLKTGINIRYSRQRIDGAGTSSTGSQGSNRLRNSVRYQPFSGTAESGDILDPDYAITLLTNPVTLAHNELKNDYRNDFISSGYVSYKILKDLTFKSTLGLTVNQRKTNSFSGTVTSVARQNAGMPVVGLTDINTLTFLNTNTLAYSPKLHKDHTLDLLIGQEINQSDTKNQGSTIKYFPVDISAEEAYASIQKAEPPAGFLQDKPTSSEFGTRLSSFFARAQYNYKGKYLSTFSVRRDGSSLFGPENKWGTFPSAQLAWRASEEDFIKNMDLNWLNNLKVRLSYGSGGNNRIPIDLYHTLFSASSTQAGYAGNDGAVNTGLYPAVLANPAIKWETVVSKNLGFDFDLLNNRLSGSVDLYINDTKDLLLSADVSAITGYPSQFQNVGKTQNKGIEFQLNGIIVKNDNFNYTSNFNIAFNRNKVEALEKGISFKNLQSGWVNDLIDFRVEVGKPVGQFYGYISDGFYKVEDFNYTANNSGVYTYVLKPDVPNSKSLIGGRDPQPGDMKVKKLSDSEDMVIGVDDKTILGTSQPKFIGGLNQQLTYKNFDLSVFVNFSFGNKEYNANKLEFTSQYNVRDNNLLAIMSDRWNWFDDNGVKVTDPTQLTAMNANAKYWTPSLGNYQLTSFAIEDASFIRINNLTIGYSLPEAWLKRTGFISRVRVYGTVNNLYTFTKYTGYDPEASTRRNALTPGVDYAAYPRSRFILGGINMTF